MRSSAVSIPFGINWGSGSGRRRARFTQRGLRWATLAVLGLGILALGAVGGWRAAQAFALSALEPPPVQSRKLRAIAETGVSAVLRAQRPGRVLAVQAEQGTVIGPGTPLFELHDLALLESREALQRKIDALRTDLEAAAAQGADADQAGREVRLAALRQLEQTREEAREDLARWRSLFGQGLIARLEYERRENEFAALDERVQAARQSAQPPPLAPSGPETRLQAELAQLERLLERLENLPDTFLARSPWEARLETVHVRVGETPARGAPLATLARAVAPQLEAAVGRNAWIAEVRAACGVPGPFAFTVHEGTLRLTAPSPGIRPGDACDLTVLARR